MSRKNDNDIVLRQTFDGPDQGYGTGYGQNGDKPKRRHAKTATPKRQQIVLTKTATNQNGDRSSVLNEV